MNRKKHVSEKDFKLQQSYELKQEMRVALRQSHLLNRERRAWYPETTAKLHLYFSTGSVN